MLCSEARIAWKQLQEQVRHTEIALSTFPASPKLRPPDPQHQLTNGSEEEPGLVNGGAAILFIVVDGDLGDRHTWGQKRRAEVRGYSEKGNKQKTRKK